MTGSNWSEETQRFRCKGRCYITAQPLAEQSYLELSAKGLFQSLGYKTHAFSMLLGPLASRSNQSKLSVTQAEDLVELMNRSSQLSYHIKPHTIF